MKIARVFPRKTAATPYDDLVFFDSPLMLSLPEIDEVHISVAFTYDRRKAEDLAFQWEIVGVPVKIGGPAYNDPAEGDFIKAAGWKCVGKSGGLRWTGKRRPEVDLYPAQMKIRFEKEN